MAWSDWLTVTPTLEEELRIEADCRAILQDEKHEEVAKLCSSLNRQVWLQRQMLKQAISKIAEMEATKTSLEIKAERPWWRRLVG